MDKQPLRTRMSEKLKQRRKLVGTLSAVLVLLLLAGLTWLLWSYFSTFSTNKEDFRAYIEGFGWAGRLVFFGLQCLQIIVAVLPGEVLEIGAGYIFGALEGTLLCVAGIAAAGTLVFWLVQRFGIRLLELFFDLDKLHELRFLNTEQKQKRLLFLLFFIPGTPKDLLTYFAPLTKITLSEFLGISLIARLPSVLSSTIGGSYLERGDYLIAAVLFVVTAGVALLGIYFYSRIVNWYHTRQERRETEE